MGVGLIGMWGSGLVVERVERSQFGTVWYVKARPPGGRVGEEGVGGCAVDTAETLRKGGVGGGRG